MTELSAYDFSTLRDGAFTLSRGLADGLAPLLLVAASGADRSLESLERLEHEFALRTELDADWAARPLELLREGAGQMLVLEDRGGEPLERLLGRPMDVGAFLRIAIPLAAAVGQAHARGLIHKDVKPGNILVDMTTGAVRLTGFGIASRVPREHQASTPPDVIAGTLEYMAPEQTGRMNRSVDSRSDLYALGVTFYEMLTGALPFTASDPMEYVHCHIARQPAPPEERVPSIPRPLSAIVLKLLAKNGEERYQTAVGLAFDLRLCLAEWNAFGRIDDFALGGQDVSDRLFVPEKLYGREREIDTLVSAFDRVVSTSVPALVLVSGYSGVGKSSVVNELQKVLVPPRGLFASGKFDQHRRDIPYATLAQAFQTLVRPLLGQTEAELARWREALRDALGENGQLVANLIPDIELVIGKQPPVPELGPQDAQSRFQMVFRRLIGVFARPEHPLALFFDDLQWLDAATLALVEHLITHPEVRHLLLVGAYRDNEVAPAHPLMRTLEALHAAGAPVQEIVLAPLERDDVGRLVADTLHCDFERAHPLAQLVHDKTAGNVFFAIQFLTALVDEGLVTFDRAASAWRWDIARIRARSYTENVVELMVGKLKRLSAPTQEALKHLASLGNVAPLATLARIRGDSEEATDAALWEAIHGGLVLRQEGTCQFLHDRIQQAAYSLIPEEQRAAVHLHIGRVLLASMAASSLAEGLFDAANQLNRGATMLVDRKETADVVEINLRAGRLAKFSAAYASARAYLAAAMTLLDDGSWASHHELAFAVWLERAECELLSGSYDTAEQLIAELLRRVTSRFDEAAVYRLKVELHITRSEKQQAVASALTCLRLFGVDLPEHPSLDEVHAEYDRFLETLGPRAVEDLVDLPLMTDRVMQAVMQTLSSLLTPSYHTDFNLWCLQVGRMVNISIRHGTTGASAHAYGFWGVALALLFHRYRDGYRFAKLARDVVEKHGLSAYQARASYSMGTVAWWTQPLSTAIECMQAGARAARDTAGDVTVVGYGLFQSVTGRLARNDPLDDVWRESQSALDFVRQNLHLREAKYGDAAPILVSQQRFIATMQGRTGSFSSFNDAHFDEVTFERELGSRMSYTIAWYWILKLKARFLSGDYAEALAAADTAKTFLSPAAFMIQLLDYHYYSALAAAALHENASPDDQGALRDRLMTPREQLREWADTYPPTFVDKYALVSAEFARLEGRDVDAVRLYEEAIRSARQQGFVQHEGVALEVAARFYAARGVATVAHAYRRDARDCYRRWGADGKVRQLEQVHPELRSDRARAPSTAMFGASVAQLDIGAVVKASHAIASEILLDQLVRTLMTIALEDAGADRGLLIVLRDGEPRIEAEATVERKVVGVRLRKDPLSSSELPESLLHTVIRTRESVILGDAATASAFSADAYFRERHPRSILCLPLIKQATFIGVLYLENHLASHVFTPGRLSVLELLSSQAAISLENARLYAELLEENRERKRAEEALRDVQAELARAARLAMMGELTASIAHEINQPLAAIMSNGAAGLRWLNRAAPELDEVGAALAHVVSDATRAADVVRGLRALATKSESRLAAFDLDDAIDDVLALTRSEMQRHDVVLRTQLTIGDQLVLGDRVQLQQVVLNLILNGIDAVKVVTDRGRELRVSSAVAAPGKALVSVEDSGVGVDPGVGHRMFEPFVTTKPNGLGIGLSICRSIIDAHGGHLGMSPGVPHGTVFHFTVSLAEST